MITRQKIKTSTRQKLALLLLCFATTLTFGQSKTDQITTKTTDAVFVNPKGLKVALSSLKGKVVFVNFWATWCGPCIQEMPSIQTLKDKFKDKDVVFLLVDIDRNFEKSQAFMDRKKFDLPLYIPEGDVPKAYLGTSIPTTVIFDKSGNMIQRITGVVDYDSPEVENFMNKVLQLK